MSEILSQSEIEALLASLNDGGAIEGAEGPDTSVANLPPAGGPSTMPPIKPGTKSGLAGFAPPARQSARTAIAYEVYDFRRPDKFSKDQLRTLQMLHETFARLAGSALSAFLRTPVNIDLISLEQVPYEEYLRSINQSVFTVMSLPPLSGQAVLEIEFSLVFSMIDRLLGGPGKGIHRTVLTDIERPLVRQNIERMFSALKSAWEGIVVVNPSIDGLETSAQFVQIAPPNDIVVTILFEVKMGSQRGAMSLCIPYLLLKPITTKLSAQKWFATGSRKVSATTRRLLSAQVSQANVDCMISLGNCRLSIKDFLKLQPGDVLRLGQKTSEDLHFFVGGIPKYEGKPALQGKKLVFTVSGVKED